MLVAVEASAYRFLGGTRENLHELGRVPRSFSAETILRRTGRQHFTAQ